MLTPDVHGTSALCCSPEGQSQPPALGEAAGGAGGAEEELAHLPWELLAPGTQPSLGIAPWGQK